MPTNRKVVFANEEYYHVFNRGIDRRPVFTTHYEYSRALAIIEYYSFHKPPLRYSKFLNLPKEDKLNILTTLKDKLVDIVAYCLMPNHFHFLLQQLRDNGISKFTANITNSYTKYFNTKHQRIGPLFQGLFKAVYVEDDEQLIHLSRYIHLNPITSYITNPKELNNYLWSSYPEYINKSHKNITNKKIVLGMFKNSEEYKRFCEDQIDYARDLKRIEHLVIDVDF